MTSTTDAHRHTSADAQKPAQYFARYEKEFCAGDMDFKVRFMLAAFPCAALAGGQVQSYALD